MILALQALCLVISLFTLQIYASSGVYSRAHRFLPLIIGLVCVEDFYQIMESITGQTLIFTRLEDLLIIQILFLFVYYMMDFLHVKLPLYVRTLLFIFLLGMDYIIISEYENQSLYSFAMVSFCAILLFMILGSATYARIKYSYSSREKKLNNTMYAAVLIPAVSLFFRNMENGDVIIPLALACSCIIVIYLILTEQITDITYLLQEKIFVSTETAYILFDADYYFLDANLAAQQYFAGDMRIGARRKGKRSFQEMLEGTFQQINEYIEVPYKEQVYRCMLKPVKQKNVIKGYIVEAQDITKEKMETSIMETGKKEAEAQVQYKSRFLANMSHELRSPLHAIIGISDILKTRKNIDEKDLVLVSHIKEAGNHLLEMVNSILMLSKLEVGKIELVKERYNFEKIIEELSRMCIINLKDKPVHFHASFLTKHPRYLIGDKVKVREMIQNLLANAVKFTQTGEITCELAIEQGRTQEEVRIICVVRDTGKGIQEEELEHIFDEYESFADKSKLEGTGLGLNIVKQLAHLMDGEVIAESDGIHGSEFILIFYQGAAGEDAEEYTINKSTLFRENANATDEFVPMWICPDVRVLIVDDMKINRLIFKELLEPWKCQIEMAEDGEQAVELVKQKSYQMIFLDNMMPGLMGIEAAAKIKKLSDTPIILMTANLSEKMETEYGRYGFSGFLEKPVNLKLLQEMMEENIPKIYRKSADKMVADKLLYDVSRNAIVYRKTLETFEREMRPLLKELPGYLKEDKELFRIKVHGLKGASRQIGKDKISEFAEIMEMAAKTDNQNFLRSHMESFLQALENVLVEVAREKDSIPVPKKEKSGEQHSVEQLFLELKNGFDDYNLKKIEEALELLEEQELDEAQTKLLMMAQVACDELEYEKGSELLSEFCDAEGGNG